MIAAVTILVALSSAVTEGLDCTCRLKMETIIPRYASSVCQNQPPKVVYHPADNSKPQALCGNSIPSAATLRSPKVSFDATELCSKNLTIVFFDIDDPKYSNPYLLWLVANVDKKSLKKGKLGKSADEIYPYVAPLLSQISKPASQGMPSLSNPANSSFKKHRCVFFLYCQSRYISPDDFKGSKVDFFQRFKFDTYAFATKYDLSSPVAANYFYSKLTVSQTVGGSIGGAKGVVGNITSTV